MTTTERRATFSLALLYVLRMLGLFMVVPVLMVYGDDMAYATPALLGLALGIYGLSQALLQIPMGWLSDRLGRKPVIAGGLLVFAAGSFLAAGSESVYGLIAGRFLQGCGAIAAALSAFLTDLTREHQRSKAMAMLGASIGLSFAIALVLGPYLASQFGLSALFYAISALALLGLPVLFLLVPPAPTVRVASDYRGLRWSLSRPELRRLDLGVFVLHAILMALFVALPGLLTEQGVARDQHWHWYLPTLILSFLLMLPLMMRVEKRASHRGMLRLAVAVLAACGLLFAHSAGSALTLALALLIFFVAFNLLEAQLPSLLSRSVHAQGKGAAMGVFSSCQFFGAFVGGALGGWVAQRFGPQYVFYLVTALALIWLLALSGMQPLAKGQTLSVAIPQAAGSDDWVERVSSLPGVIDITLLEQEGVAWLRVSEEFDQQRLSALG